LLNVPLAVRLGDSHITREVAAVRFRKEAVGGVRNITLRLARPLDRVDQIAAYMRVYLYDARSAVTIAEGRISDLGRGVDSGSGQQWDLVAFGPVQHASDMTVPLIYVDRQVDRWKRGVNSTPGATTDTGEIDEDTPTLEVRAEEGKTVGTSWRGDWNYRSIRDASMFLARVSCDMDSGVSDANYRQQIDTRINSGTVTVARDIASSTTLSSRNAVVVTDWTNGDDTVTLRALRQTAGTTGAETHWFQFSNIVVRARLKAADGTDITTGYGLDYVVVPDVVKDLLGRVLDQYDGTNAVVATGTGNAVDQLAYPDGVTPAQVLDDMMALDPAMYWYAGPSDPATGLYSFTWKAWPTTVRYEVSLDDGGSFPISAQELYNKVAVRWTKQNGRVRSVTRTGAVPILDDAEPPVTRQAIIDVGDEVGSAANATLIGDNFLADHKYPANAGSLTISRPIRDLTTGAMVEPFEIEPGELIRVRGVESYPDALNASSNDGQTVFRIWSMEYDSDSNSASLELDTYSRTTANAIARLITRRARKR